MQILSGYGIGFDTQGCFSLSDVSGFGKNVIIFGDDNSSSKYADNRKSYIIGQGITDGLDETTMTAEMECSINLLNNK